MYLVALDDDWDSRPENQARNGTIHPRRLFALPPMYTGTTQAAAIASYNIKAAQFEHQQRVRADLHSAISRSLGTVTLSPSILNIASALVRFHLSNSLAKSRPCSAPSFTKHEIDATQDAILAPLVHFANFRDFCSSITQNYEFLTSAGHNIPELTRIDNFIAAGGSDVVSI